MALQAAQCNRGSPLAALFTENGGTSKCPVHGEACEEFHRLEQRVKLLEGDKEALRAALERLRGDAVTMLHREPVLCFDETVAEVDSALGRT